MTSKEEVLDNVTEEQVQDNLESGIIMAIQDQKKVLDEQIKDLSKNELTRLIKNAANFPTPIPTSGERENEATVTLYTIKDLQVEMALVTLGRLQKDNSEKGESNE